MAKPRISREDRDATGGTDTPTAVPVLIVDRDALLVGLAGRVSGSYSPRP